MPAEPPVAIGLDLGTSGLKAVAVDPAGAVLARGAGSYPTSRPEPDAAEQDPRHWLAAIDAALADIAREVAPARWGVIGLSAMLPTLVATDASGTPVHPAITWEDARAEPQAAAFIERFGEARLTTSTGQRIDGRYLLPMLARLREHGARPAWMLGAKDWLVHAFTGTALTDPSTAAGSGAYALAAGTWMPELTAFVGSPMLPEVVPTTTPMPLLPEVADRWGCRADTPLVVGAADSVLGAYGMGVRTPGTIAAIAGTSTVFLGVADTPAAEPGSPYLVTPDAAGGWARETDLVTTGSALAWLARLLGTASVADLLAAADTAPLADAPLVLPFLGPGEQGALWDPTLVGASSGFTLRTGPAEFALGLLAGIVLESARCVDALSTGGSTDGEIVASGSGATAPYLRRLADATGRVVRAHEHEHDHSAIGAALLAGRAVLGFADGTGPRPGLVFEPDPAERAAWHARFARHEAARHTLGTARPEDGTT